MNLLIMQPCQHSLSPNVGLDGVFRTPKWMFMSANGSIEQLGLQGQRWGVSPGMVVCSIIGTQLHELFSNASLLSCQSTSYFYMLLSTLHHISFLHPVLGCVPSSMRTPNCEEAGPGRGWPYTCEHLQSEKRLGPPALCDVQSWFCLWLAPKSAGGAVAVWLSLHDEQRCAQVRPELAQRMMSTMHLGCCHHTPHCTSLKIVLQTCLTGPFAANAMFSGMFPSFLGPSKPAVGSCGSPRSRN